MDAKVIHASIFYSQDSRPEQFQLSQYKFNDKNRQAHNFKAEGNQNRERQSVVSIDKMEIPLTSPDTKSVKSKEMRY